SSTGALSCSSAQFTPSSFAISGSGTACSNLTLSIQSLHPGIYYLTVSARLGQENAIYSVVLKLVVVSDSSPYTQLFSYAAIIGVVASILAVGVLSLRDRGKRGRMLRTGSRGRVKRRTLHALGVSDGLAN
ncbi:MAG: hypothetical protein ACRDF4_09695, partial [Rhabdochlamydiaceae bacterium]